MRAIYHYLPSDIDFQSGLICKQNSSALRVVCLGICMNADEHIYFLAVKIR